MGAHAILSPSSASRWLACTPSARLEAEFPDTAGEAAEEGTLAHAVGELLIRHRRGEIKKPVFNARLSELQQSKYYNEALHQYAEDYAAHVLEQFAEAAAADPHALLFLEQRLDLTDFVPEGFGTGDAVIVANGDMHIIDLKYGKGVPVSAIGNKQMRLYALGALKAFEFAYEVETARMTIYQPRLDNITTDSVSIAELTAWAENELIPRARLAFDGEGELVPGDHCRFCKVAARCRALAEHNLSLAKHEFKSPHLLSDDEIADILHGIDGLTNWAGKVETYALAEAVNNGKKWPGWKLVEGRSNRKYADEQAAADTLLKNGWKQAEIYNMKLLGLTDMEKLLGGKKPFADLLGPYVVKPPGKPTLVPQDDKRAELSSTANAHVDFAEVEIED